MNTVEYKNWNASGMKSNREKTKAELIMDLDELEQRMERWNELYAQLSDKFTKESREHAELKKKYEALVALVKTLL